MSETPGGELFRCEAFACILPERACIARQEFRIRAAGFGRRWSGFAACDPARCRQGRGIRRGLRLQGLLRLVLLWAAGQRSQFFGRQRAQAATRREFRRYERLSNLPADAPGLSL
jgi:hypothetical protein